MGLGFKPNSAQISKLGHLIQWDATCTKVTKTLLLNDIRPASIPTDAKCAKCTKTSLRRLPNDPSTFLNLRTDRVYVVTERAHPDVRNTLSIAVY